MTTPAPDHVAANVAAIRDAMAQASKDQPSPSAAAEPGGDTHPLEPGNEGRLST